MPDRELRVIISGSSEGAVRAMAEADAAAEESSKGIGDHFESAGGKVGGIFSRLGQKMESMGIPFGKSVSEVGAKLDEMDSKGKKFAGAMSAAGGAILAVGATAALGVAAESIRLADEFDISQALLKTAVVNSGHSWGSMQGQMLSAERGAANLGFNMTEAAGALQTLTTATNNPAEALKTLGLAEDLARMKNISLQSASQTMAKVFAGSTRALTQLGINIDIGTGKLSAIHTATETVTTDQIKLRQAEAEVADGTLKGVKGTIALTNAHRALSLATEKLHRDQGTIAKILATVEQRTKGAAAAYGQTLGGQVEIAKARIHDLGIQFGEFLIPKLAAALKGVMGLVTWFEKHSWAAKVLAGVIGTVLGGAIAFFVVNKIAQFAGGIQKMASGFANMVSSIVGGAATTEVAEEGMAATSEETGAATTTAFGPVGLAIAAIAIIGFEVYRHWKQIWAGIKDVAHAFASWFSDVWKNGIVKDILYVLVPMLYVGTHWKQIWDGIKTAALTVWHFLDDNVIHPIAHAFDVVFTGAINGAKRVWDAMWGGIKHAAKTAWDWVHNNVLVPLHVFFATTWHNVITTAKLLWKDFWSGVKVAVQLAWDVIGPIVHLVTNAVKDITKAWNFIFGGGPTKAPPVGAGGGRAGAGSPRPKGVAGGGYISSPGIFMVGEAGPELVLNPQLTKLVMAARVNPSPLTTAGGFGGGSSGPITMDVRLVIDGRQFAQATVNDIRAALLRKGRSTINIGLS